ncbi:MAG TPA: lytic transglycosylase domain-containing protein, partial [Elusimicrobiota bacterium]|nr:lytic transglycosylase domain-containing protein [Elusimicrobiota bacterium]
GEYKIDPLWVMAVIKVESGFASSARSSRGAVGLMQLLPSTARQLAGEVGMADVQDGDLEKPDINLHLGIYYLSKLQTIFPDDDIAVLAAYNAGPSITREWRKGKPALDFDDIPYGETRRFVRRVDQTFGFLKMIQGWKHIFGISRGR